MSNLLGKFFSLFIHNMSQNKGIRGDFAAKRGLNNGKISTF